MTTYDASSVSDAVIAFRKPITLQQGRGLRDNPIAMAEGATDAPRIQGYALASDNNGLLPVSVSAADTVAISAGHGPLAGVVSTNSTSFVLGQTYIINAYNGSMRFKISHNVGSSSVSTLEFRKNGTVIQTFTTTSTTPVQRTVDSTVSLGDEFEWYHKQDFAGNSSQISGPLVYASDGYIPRFAFWLASQA